MKVIFAWSLKEPLVIYLQLQCYTIKFYRHCKLLIELCALNRNSPQFYLKTSEFQIRKSSSGKIILRFEIVRNSQKTNSKFQQKQIKQIYWIGFGNFSRIQRQKDMFKKPLHFRSCKLKLFSLNTALLQLLFFFVWALRILLNGLKSCHQCFHALIQLSRFIK